MTTETVNSLRRYFETLHSINRNAIALCGVDINLINFDYEKLLLEIVSNITRIIPITYEQSSKNLVLKYSDGILSLKDNFNDIKGDIESIILNKSEFLNSIRLIRNSYQHKVHLITTPSLSTSSFTLPSIRVELEEPKKIIDFEITSLLILLKELNKAMSKVMDSVRIYKSDEEKKQNFSLYLERLTFMDFLEYNTIYNLDPKTLISIGKSTISF